MVVTVFELPRRFGGKTEAGAGFRSKFGLVIGVEFEIEIDIGFGIGIRIRFGRGLGVRGAALASLARRCYSGRWLLGGSA